MPENNHDVWPANPYFDYATVRNPAMFFGRETELRKLYEASHRQQSISLVGLRRIGKSSILRYMGLPQVQEQFMTQFGYELQNRIFVLIDLHDYLHKNREDFFRSVSEQILAQAQKVVDIKTSARSGEDQLTELLEEIEKVGYHPILLMDAFDKVTANTQFDPDFFSFMRSLATRGRVSYITASMKQLYEMAHEKILTSPFFDIFETCKVGPLTREAAEHFVVLPSRRAECEFTPEEMTWILDQAGLHPFFLQIICRFFFEEKRKQRDSSADVKHVQERVYRELFPHFEKVWDDLSEEQQKVLKYESRMAGKMERLLPELSGSALFRRYIHEKFRVDQLDIAVKDVRDALDNLDENDMLATCKLSEMHYVFTRYQRETMPSAHRKGLIVHDFLKAAFERLRPSGVRTETAFEWRSYNILYYRYFRHHLQNEHTAARLGISSRRQYYREQDKAIQALLKELIDMEATSLNESEHVIER